MTTTDYFIDWTLNISIVATMQTPRGVEAQYSIARNDQFPNARLTYSP